LNKTIGIVVIILLFIITLALSGYIYLAHNDGKEEDKPVVITNTTDIHTPSIRMLEEGKDDEKLSQIGPLYPLNQLI